MEFNEYNSEAIKTAGKTENWMENAVYGIISEVGEIIGIIKKHKFQGHEINIEDISNEIGDVLWYLNLMAQANGTTLEKCAEKNINKMKLRYPDGIFSTELSIKRSDVLHKN